MKEGEKIHKGEDGFRGGGNAKVTPRRKRSRSWVVPENAAKKERVTNKGNRVGEQNLGKNRERKWFRRKRLFKRSRTKRGEVSIPGAFQKTKEQKGARSRSRVAVVGGQGRRLRRWRLERKRSWEGELQRSRTSGREGSKTTGVFN